MKNGGKTECKHFIHTSARPLLCPLPGIKMLNAKMFGVGVFYTPCSFDSARARGISCPSILSFILLLLNAYTVVLSSCYSSPVFFSISLNLFLQSNYQLELYYYRVNVKLRIAPVIKKKIVLKCRQLH